MPNGTTQRRRKGLNVGVEELGFRDSFAEAIEQSLTEAAGNRINFFDWALKVPEPKRPLDFEKFPMQKEMYQEGADEGRAVIMKSTQVGVSAWALRWMIYHADTRGFTGLYLLPRREDVYDFSDARVKPVVENSNYLRSRVMPEDPSNKGLRKIGLGIIYFRGSETKRGLDTADVDALVMDEYDTLNQENIPDAERRLSGITSANLLRRVGVPSIPNWGISRMYEDSDKRKWMAKCEHCGEWQTPTFLENVDQLREVLVCAHCFKGLNVAKGHWVAEHPDRDIRGYHLTRLIAPGANLHDIIVASRQRLPHQRKTFFNKDLGEPFAPEEGRLSREAISACVREFTQEMGYVGNNLVTMGVDVASTRALNVRISEHTSDTHKRALLLKEVDSFDELALLMDRFCLTPAARVLGEDLIWHPVGSLEPGARIIGFDEHTHRKMNRAHRVAIVESCDRIERPCYRITMTDGRVVTASADHYWLRATNVHPPRLNKAMVAALIGTPYAFATTGHWIATRDLKPGSRIKNFGQPWNVDDGRDAGYLAGVFDGEGSLRPGPGYQVSFAQNPGVVLDRVRGLLDERGYAVVGGKQGKRRCIQINVQGAYDVMRFLGETRPERLLAKVPAWIDGRQAAMSGKHNYATVESVEFVGTQEVVAIGTSTGTLIAEGLYSHNSVNMACIDHLPEGRLARSFAERFAGRVMIVAYNTNPSPKDDQVLMVKEDAKFVTARRVEAMDATAEQFRQQHNLLPADLPHGYVDALQAPVRLVSENELGRKTVSYRSMGADDWFHCECYDLIAQEMFLHRQITTELHREDLTRLEDSLEFQRSALGDYDSGDGEYNPGGREDYPRGLE